jgi:hypothetical protein
LDPVLAFALFDLVSQLDVGKKLDAEFFHASESLQGLADGLYLLA